MSAVDLSPRQAMALGATRSIPLIIGGIPFGLIFGSLAATQGIPFWATILLSCWVFAGSAQFIVLGLFAAGAPIWLIIFTTFIVNLRHMLYAADLVKFLKHLALPWRMLLSFGLTDETYAAVRPLYDTGHISTVQGHWALLGSSLSFYLMWNSVTIIGYITGSLLPDVSRWGLEFAMVVTFIGIIAPYLNSLPYWGAFLSAAGFSLYLYDLPNNLGLISAALIGMAVGVICVRFKPNITQGIRP